MVLAPGQLIDRYELVAPIGEGGMAHVWAARRSLDGRIVALKIIHSRFAEDPDFRAMFLDEARIVTPIQHPNVAQVYELGQHPSLLYLAMEYVEGESVAGLTTPDRVVPPSIALRVAADACAGLHAVHARGVVHRDVSPQNVLVGTNGEVKLIDFGIAHAAERSAPMTEAGSVRGKVRYMAPEQARREMLGPYTDVFGIGATLFRMLSGRAPYAGTNDVETLQALIANRPALHSLPANLPQEIRHLIERAIAPRIRDRFPSVREFGLAIEALLANEPRPDLGAWVAANLSADTRARKARLAPPPPPELDPPKGFMDVGALVARAQSGQDVPLELADERRYAPRPDLPGRTRAIRLAIVAVIGAFLAVALLLFLPAIAKSRAIAEAREVGVDVTIEGVGVGFSGVTLREITARAVGKPGITATIREAHFGFHDASFLGVDARLQGPRNDVLVDLAFLAESARKHFAGDAKSAEHLSVASARVTWDGIEGPESQLNAGDIGLELESRGPGSETVRSTVGAFDLKLPTTKLGPWATSLERTPLSSRLRLMFDPQVPDGPSAQLVWGPAVPTEATLKIPRSSFQHLGMSASDLGIPADDLTELEVSFQGRFPAAARSETRTELTLHRVRPKGSSGPIDIHVDGHAGGEPGKPLDLERTIVTVGPFTAGVSGTVTPYSYGLQIDATFKTLPLTCEKFVRNEAKNMGPIVSALQAFGQTTGAFRVNGNVNVAGTVAFDTAAPDDVRVQWTARETCGVSIFGK